MSKELLKLFESMKHHSWKYIGMFAEAWFNLSIFLSFYLSIFLSFNLSIFLLITNQFGSVQKMKLDKERVISKDDADGHLEPTWISLD
jgi:hypothetical protein